MLKTLLAVSFLTNTSKQTSLCCCFSCHLSHFVENSSDVKLRRVIARGNVWETSPTSNSRFFSKYARSSAKSLIMDLDTAMAAILKVCSESLAMKRATVTIVDEETSQLVIRASHGLTGEEKRRGVYRLDEGVTGRIFQTGTPFIVPDIDKEPLFLNRTRSRQLEKGRVSFVGVPVMVKGKTAGVLTVDRLFGDDISFEEDIRFLTIVAALVSQIVSLNSQMRAREEGLRRENLSLRLKLSNNYQQLFLTGKSHAMARVRQMIEKVAPTKATVLLLGESGTGKTLTARIVHELSDRAKYPFIKVNCAAIPEPLLESELFGYEKGRVHGCCGLQTGPFRRS